jgi:hypothetical protein
MKRLLMPPIDFAALVQMGWRPAFAAPANQESVILGPRDNMSRSGSLASGRRYTLRFWYGSRFP